MQAPGAQRARCCQLASSTIQHACHGNERQHYVAGCWTYLGGLSGCCPPANSTTKQGRKTHFEKSCFASQHHMLVQFEDDNSNCTLVRLLGLLQC
jgi:hypothetical protein